jgi:hypothetical protein
VGDISTWAEFESHPLHHYGKTYRGFTKGNSFA